MPYKAQHSRNHFFDRIDALPQSGITATERRPYSAALRFPGLTGYYCFKNYISQSSGEHREKIPEDITL